jgi:hypothetical protein
MDFRFQNVSGNCPGENTISLMDDMMTTFTCTSNNNFVIQQLYSSNRNYINLTYDGHTAGGYLWLTFICEYKNTENSYSKRLKIPKGQSEVVSRRRADNTIAKENEQVEQP